jgi:hypothetical protein
MTEPVKDEYAEHAKALVTALWSDKQAGPLLRAKAKELNPGLVLQEDALEPVLAPMREENATLKDQLKSALDRLDARDKADTERQAEQSMENALNAAKAKFRLTDEGFQKMVDRMKETSNFTDAEAAAAWVAQQTPPPEQAKPSWRPSGVKVLNAEGDEDLKRLHKDPSGFLDDELEAFARDPMGFTRQYAPEFFNQ